MTDQTAPVSTGVDAQPSAVANSIESIIDEAVAESAKAATGDEGASEDQSKSETNNPKELSPAEELDKLRKAKARDDRRIGKLTAQKYQAQKETEDLRARFSNTQPVPQAELSVSKTGIPTKLNPDSFANWADYSEARSEEIADHKINKRFAEHESRTQQTQQSQQEQQWVAQREALVSKQAQDFAKEAPDIADLVEEYADIVDSYPKELQQAFLAADNAPLAFYNLAKNGKLEDLASISLVDAKVEIRLAQMKPVEKPKTKAPTPLPAARGAVAGGKRLEDLSGDEMRSFLRG